MAREMTADEADDLISEYGTAEIARHYGWTVERDALGAPAVKSDAAANDNPTSNGRAA